MPAIANLQIELEYWQKNMHYIAGADEVGRGPLAGPVTACAIIFEPHFWLPEVRDSKQLSAEQREELFRYLRREALTIGIGWASMDEIEEINIRQATFLAMRRAVAELAVEPDILLVDGDELPVSPVPTVGIINGDELSFTISAASIIAKVTRDNYMQEMHEKYPLYHFNKNKGYGTREHIEAIRKYGPCEIHRPTFLRKIIAEEAF